MFKEKRKNVIGRGFWLGVIKKLIETVISVKVIVISTVLIISTEFVYTGLMTGAEWGMVNGGVISTVFTLREAFKISKVKSEDDTTDMKV